MWKHTASVLRNIIASGLDTYQSKSLNFKFKSRKFSPVNFTQGTEGFITVHTGVQFDFAVSPIHMIHQTEFGTEQFVTLGTLVFLC